MKAYQDRKFGAAAGRMVVSGTASATTEGGYWKAPNRAMYGAEAAAYFVPQTLRHEQEFSVHGDAEEFRTLYRKGRVRTLADYREVLDARLNALMEDWEEGASKPPFTEGYPGDPCGHQTGII